MECKDCNALLLEHWRGELSAPRTAELQDHWGHCATCREEAAALGVLWQDLDWEASPPAALVQTLETRLRAGLHGGGRETPQPAAPWFQRLWPARPAMAFLYSLCLLVSGIALGDGLRPLDRLLPTEDLDARIASGQLAAADLSPASLVRLCAVPQQSEVETL